MSNRGRRLAFDYGSVRIGVAVCDPDGILATPLPFLSSTHPRLTLQITDLIDEYQPIEIFIGYPKHLSGANGESVALVEKFRESLSSLTKVPLTFIDERLSTVSAARALKEAGKSSKDSRALIDSMSAVAILEQGLLIEKR
jgi:putative Holliday junction resolvase